MMATRMLNDLGLDWREFARRALCYRIEARPEAPRQSYRPEPPKREPPKYEWPPRRDDNPFSDPKPKSTPLRWARTGSIFNEPDWKRNVYDYLLSECPLTPWEREFISSLKRQHPKRHSDKQYARFSEIADKYGAWEVGSAYEAW
jgi:hypothetical protein